MQRIPPEFVANHGAELPFDCRLVMPKGRQWRVRLLRIASGCHFHAGWADFRIVNNIVHNDFLTFTMVDVGVFHVKRYKPNTGCPPLSDLQSKYVTNALLSVLTCLSCSLSLTDPYLRTPF